MFAIREFEKLLSNFKDNHLFCKKMFANIKNVRVLIFFFSNLKSVHDLENLKSVHEFRKLNVYLKNVQKFK